MFLALFPLQLVLFPTEEIPLHIFEPRYKQLIAECRDEGVTFGIPPLDAGNLSKIGTEVELVRIIKTYDTGEMDIVVRGLRVFEIDDFQADVPDKLYSAATVTIIENEADPNRETGRKLLKLYAEFVRLARIGAPVPEEVPEKASFVLGSHVGLSLAQRLSMLRMPKESERQKFLSQYLESAIHAIRQRPSRGIKLGGGNGSVRPVGD